MKPPVKVKLTTCTCRRCKRTFKSYFYWYEHVRQEHGSVFIKSPGNISFSSENTISLGQYLKTTTEEQTFVESTSSYSLQDDKEESLPVIENQTNLSTLPQNEASGATTSQDLDVCEQTSFSKTSDTSVESDTNFSSDQGAKTPAASGNPNSEASTASEEAEGNTGGQTSSDQTSGTDPNLSSGEGVVTHNPDVHAEASSDPKNEPSASSQQAENKPAPGLFSWNKESLSREVETLTENSDPKNELSASSQEAEDKTAAELISLNQEKLLQEMETSIDSEVVDRLKSIKSSSITLRKVEKPVFDRQNCTLNSLWYHKSDEEAADIELPPFNEKDGGRFTLEPPPKPIDLSAKLRAITAIKNSRGSKKPRLKELFGSLSLPVFDPSTGTTVLRPRIVEIQSATPYEQQELSPCESPIEIAERIQARLSHSKERDREMSTNEDMDETGEGNISDKGISVSGEETDETDEASSDLINYTSTPYQQTEDNTAAQNSSNQTSGTSPQKSETNFARGLGAKTLTASSNTKNEQSTPCQQAEDNTAAQSSSNQTSGTSLESHSNFSSGHTAKTLTGSSDSKNEPSTSYKEAEDNTAEQTSCSQTSGISTRESDTNFSSDHTAKTLSASSDPKTEPSTPCQQTEDNTAAETLSNQVNGTSLESNANFSSGLRAKALTASSDPKNEPSSTPCEEAGDNTVAQTSSNQTSEISLESDTHFSSDHTAKTLSASSDPKTEPSTPCQQTEDNTAAQTLSNQTSGISLESDTNFSSGEGAMTHNPDVHAETSSDPTNEPSTSYQHAENKTAPGLFSLYKESPSQEVETLTASNDPKNEPSTPYEEAGDNTAAELISLNQEKLLQEMETSIDSEIVDRFCVLDGLEEMSTNQDRTWKRWIREIIFQMKEFLFEAGQILTLESWTDRAL